MAEGLPSDFLVIELKELGEGRSLRRQVVVIRENDGQSIRPRKPSEKNLWWNSAMMPSGCAAASLRMSCGSLMSCSRQRAPVFMKRKMPDRQSRPDEPQILIETTMFLGCFIRMG